MTDKPLSKNLLQNRTVALPENRQLDVLARLLEKRGATVMRCPLIAILDAPDEKPVLAWIRRMIKAPFDLFIIYTGEGIYRLIGFAERAGLREAFVEALGKTPKLARGPKPGRALQTLGMKPDINASTPTTEGIIQTLESTELDGKRVGIQLYGTDLVEKLMKYLRSRGAKPDCVAPYVYASAAEDAQGVALIRQMQTGKVDAIAFTSKTQVKRLLQLANQQGLEKELAEALTNITIAAIGPIVAEELNNAGLPVHVMPETSYFMKPLVTELTKAINKKPA